MVRPQSIHPVEAKSLIGEYFYFLFTFPLKILFKNPFPPEAAAVESFARLVEPLTSLSTSLGFSVEFGVMESSGAGGGGSQGIGISRSAAEEGCDARSSCFSGLILLLGDYNLNDSSEPRIL